MFLFQLKPTQQQSVHVTNYFLKEIVLQTQIAHGIHQRNYVPLVCPLRYSILIIVMASIKVLAQKLMDVVGMEVNAHSSLGVQHLPKLQIRNARQYRINALQMELIVWN